MSGILQTLRLSRRVPASNFLQFLLRYKHQEKTLHVFFEGPEDESVYVNHLESQKPPGFAIIRYRCSSKEDVYRIHDRIDFATYRKERVLFFADKDLSDLLEEVWPVDSNIFVTDYYSVENYLVTVEMLERILREIIHVYDFDQIQISCETFCTQHYSTPRKS